MDQPVGRYMSCARENGGSANAAMNESDAYAWRDIGASIGVREADAYPNDQIEVPSPRVAVPRVQLGSARGAPQSGAPRCRNYAERDLLSALLRIAIFRGNAPAAF